jgi:hypothetical protein
MIPWRFGKKKDCKVKVKTRKKIMDWFEPNKRKSTKTRDRKDILLPGGIPNLKLDGGVIKANGLGEESGCFPTIPPRSGKSIPTEK